ncbi:putative metalloprotease [Flavobacterium resistens]|uniref:M48 family metalloprotease n=1 Tax=Flavobacterium resistens TaxID=443612 RepID=A0A521EPC4_9FLAO|nr:M48 family metalloprotease [Flavobacterium resistens]MRX67818.1 M48 family metalloprotease [Flavobacterium resistens]SMO85764.1 putative metalloprotease [Flavobacterium resistens]
MKKKLIVLGILFATFGFNKINAQEDSEKKELSLLDKTMIGFTFSDADAAAMAQQTVAELDANNPIASSTDGYTIRLNRLFGKHASSEGVTLNYKVYLVKDINAFACADGSVRVFAGLMDIMDDNELLAVIGHEIGHVVNQDTKNHIKALYRKEALLHAASSQSEAFKTISKTELGKFGSKLIDSGHSKKQESKADLFAYDFMKKHGYNVNAVESSFRILQKASEGEDSSFISRMQRSHPEPGKRADDAKKRATKDGLYSAYEKQKIDNTVPVKAKTATKITVKKTTAKKK